MRNTTLKPDEKEFVQSVCCLLIFESGACILARKKLSNLNHIHDQMKEVFETKCRQVDLDRPGIMNHCDGLSL
jgi:hypothetical protein